MSRKQSTVERIRKKKAAAPPPSPYDDAADPFHNGQTPACRSLLDAVQDIFPELQQQMKHQTDSSELGQLLRWQILKRRKERAFPPAPPLLSFSPQSTKGKEPSEEADETGMNPSSASKKKRKKKKKKKDAGGASAADIELKPSGSIESDMGGATLNQIPQESKNPVVSPPLNGDSSDDDDIQIIPLKDEATGNIDFEPSLHSLDRSIHDMEEERVMLQNAITPTLYHLPSDDGSVDDFHEEGHSSMAFFNQIQQESTEREDDDSAGYDITLSIPSDGNLDINGSLDPTRTPPGNSNRPRLRQRALSSESFESFQSYHSYGGVVTPTTKNTSEEDDDDANLPLKSPVTHEWVPEDGATPKTETPPGDAIKNPLDLPYLLTLSTNNGLTTTTIDGSLISAERSDDQTPDQKASSIETTKMLMEDWMGQLVDHNDKNGKGVFSDQQMEGDCHSFVNFLQKKVRNGSEPLGIPLPQLKEAVTSIDCSSCQQDALVLVNKWSEREEKKPLVLNPAVLQDWTPQDANDVETAFDYVALEEGHHLPTPEPPDEEDGEDVDRGTHISFYVAEPNSKKNGTRHIFIDQISPRHLNSLVENWLPCGIEEEILVATSVGDSSSDCGYNVGSPRPEVLDHEQVAKIQSLVLENEKANKDVLDEIDQQGKDIQDELDQILSSLPTSPQNLDVKTFPKMKNVDQLCTDYSDKLLRTLQTIAGGRSDALVHLKLRLWTAYLEALNKILKACDSYYSTLGDDMADSRGVLPKPYVDAGFRKLFQTLLEEKVQVWTGFGKLLCGHMRGRVLKELYTRTVWYSERASATDPKSLTLDEKCTDLIQELADWTETIMGGRMADIYRERMAQTERLLEVLQAVIEPLAEQYASVEKYFSTERNLYFASLRSNIVLAQGVKKRMRLIDNAEVEGMTTGVILMWTHVRLMQSRMINSSGIPPLPLQLKRWMLQDENPLMEGWNGLGASSPLNSYHQRYCQPGRQGKRRVMCILAGLVYRWLEEQCKVWKAEKAEKELLTDFDFGPPPAASSSNAKDTTGLGKPTKAKKNKKKKNKNVAPSNDVGSTLQEDPSETEHQSNTDLNGGIAVSTESSDESKSNDPEVKEHLVPEDSQDPVLSKEEDGSLETPPDPADNTSDNGETVGASGDATEDDDESIDDATELESYQSQVFIEDGDQTIPAEEFLISRMRQMLLSNKSEDIVVIV
jgi:hypothetical protein